MIRRPPRSTRTDTLFPYTTLFRSISDRAPTKVVLPAPKPPATTNFTARMRGFQSAPAGRSSCWTVIVSSRGSPGVAHARPEVELDLLGTGLVRPEAPLGAEGGGAEGGAAHDWADRNSGVEGRGVLVRIDIG